MYFKLFRLSVNALYILYGKFFPESINCLALNLSTRLYVKWIPKISSQASSDLSKMALLWVALSLYVFYTICSAFPALGLFPLGVSFPLDQVQL